MTFEDTVQGWVYDIGLGFAAIQQRMQGTEHDIAFFQALGCAIALHCIALTPFIYGLPPLPPTPSSFIYGLPPLPDQVA